MHLRACASFYLLALSFVVGPLIQTFPLRADQANSCIRFMGITANQNNIMKIIIDMTLFSVSNKAYFVAFVLKMLVSHIVYGSLFHYMQCTTPKRVTSLRSPFSRHCARATQLLSKKCCSGGEPSATLRPI